MKKMKNRKNDCNITFDTIEKQEINVLDKGKIEFSKMKIPIELDYDYDKYISSQTCTIEESLMPENRILEKVEYTMSELSKSSSLTYFIEYHNKERIESENFLCVIFLSGRFERNKVVFKYLEKGIDNLLLWEYECIKKYSTDEHVGEQYRIENIKLIFEDELENLSVDEKIQEYKEFRSSVYQSKDFKIDVTTEYDKYCYRSEVNDRKYLEVKYKSIFLNYLNEYTNDSLRKYLSNIKIKISFGTDSYFYSKYTMGTMGLINFEIDFLKWTKKVNSNPKSNIHGLDYRIDVIEIEFIVDSSRYPKLGLYMWDWQKQ